MKAKMRRLLTASSMLALLACGPKPSPTTVEPQSVETLTLYDNADELLLSVLGALRENDVATVRASMATPGQVEAMCHEFTVIETPYDEPDIETAAARCNEMMINQDEDTFTSVIRGKISGINKPVEDTRFTTYWAERCPELKVYQVETVIETIEDPNAPMTGFEVSDVFEYRGKWGLMSIPRCRGY